MLGSDPSPKKAELKIPTLELPTTANYKRLSIGPPVRLRRHADKRLSEIPGDDIVNTVSSLGQAAIYHPVPLERLPNSFCNKKSNLEHLELAKARLYHHPQENLEQFFCELSAKGYNHLTEILQGEKEFPFPEILNVKFPELMEQLLDLHFIITQKEIIHKKGSGEDILIFALHAAQSATSTDFYEVRWMLGKLIYLTETNFVRPIEHVNLESIDGTQDWIRLQFDLDIMKVQNKLAYYVSRQEIINIQNSKQASKAQLTIELSKLLITEIGTINAGLITPLLQMFVKDLKNPLNHELSLIYGLQLLEKTPQLRNQFLKINAPNPRTPADTLTRIILSYPNEIELTKIDARKAILSAMISHLRQARTGSCFATSWAIELMSCQLSQCLTDFMAIMQNSKLTRKVGTQIVEFPFLLSSNGKSLESEFWVDAFGKLKTSEELLYIWDVPGFIAACHIIGIANKEEVMKKVLLDYFHDKKDPDRFKLISVDEFLRLLVDWVVSYNLARGESAESLFRKGSFAYDSQISNPILHVWMNAIAGMSEAVSSSMITTQIISAVSGALDFLENESKMSTAGKIKLSIYSRLFTQLSRRVRLEYDPSIRGERSDGAFVLYDKGSISASRGWMRIDTPLKFQQLVVEIIEAAKKNISLTILNLHTIQMLEDYVSRLKQFTLSDNFLIKVIQFYDPLLAANEHKLDSLLRLPYTPWITKAGNDTAKTLQVYLEKDKPPEMEKLFAVNAEDLLTKIIDLAKSTYLIDKSFMTNPGKLVSLRIPGVHAFSLMLGHVSLSSAAQSQTSAADWIKQNLVESGKKVALSEVGPGLHTGLMQHCMQFLTTKESKDRFVKNIKHLSDKATIYSFRNRLLENLQGVAPLDGMLLKRRTMSIDTFLCQNLPSAQKYQLEKNAIHFADTNLPNDEKDIHYCCMFNPGSGQVEVWEADDSGAFLSAVDQSICTHQTWEFCRDSNDILPDNERLEI